MRHKAFGMDIAGQVVDNHLNRDALLKKMTAGARVGTAADAMQRGGRESRGSDRKLQAEVPGLTADEAEMVAGGSSLVTGLWPSSDLAASGRYVGHAESAAGSSKSSRLNKLLGCAATREVEGEDGNFYSIGKHMTEFLRQEPWMPRPMLSVHVRQGDKAQEMRLMPFDAYMLAAYRVREYEPFLQNVWLSTEMQVGGWIL